MGHFLQLVMTLKKVTNAIVSAFEHQFDISRNDMKNNRVEVRLSQCWQIDIHLTIWQWTNLCWQNKSSDSLRLFVKLEIRTSYQKSIFGRIPNVQCSLIDKIDRRCKTPVMFAVLPNTVCIVICLTWSCLQGFVSCRKCECTR